MQMVNVLWLILQDHFYVESYFRGGKESGLRSVQLCAKHKERTITFLPMIQKPAFEGYSCLLIMRFPSKRASLF